MPNELFLLATESGFGLGALQEVQTQSVTAPRVQLPCTVCCASPLKSPSRATAIRPALHYCSHSAKHCTVSLVLSVTACSAGVTRARMHSTVGSTCGLSARTDAYLTPFQIFSRVCTIVPIEITKFVAIVMFFCKVHFCARNV